MRPTHQFSQTKTAEIPRSSFDLSHGLKTTIEKGGHLVPILSLEVLPGDTINCRASLFGRLATPIKPILDNLYLETFFFFTPYRQLWDNWEKFNGEQIQPGDSTDFVIPIMDRGPGGGVLLEGTVGDYLGLPPGLDPDIVKVSAFPFRAYNKIWNFWFRDENLMTAVTENTDDGPDPLNNNNNLRFRRKRRDYLTSCLPWPQKGEEVILPIGDRAEVFADADLYTAGDIVQISDSANPLTDTVSMQQTGPSIDWSTAGPTGFPGHLYADLQGATGISINDFRESFQIQKLFERDARGGTRYPEILMSHFRVSDPGLLVQQRPLFLGGGSSQINISPVAQTTDQLEAAAGDTPQGNLAAYGTVSGTGHGFTASFTEHGHIIGLVNLRADITYQQGIERYWSRQTRFDFYWPALSHIGEQAVLNKEIFINNDVLEDDKVFGYMPRYDEYRFKQSQITSIFRSSAEASLDVWHLAQDFAVQPVLNQTFISDTPPIDRVIAVPDEPVLLLDVFFKIRAARPLPLYATPGLIDHF